MQEELRKKLFVELLDILINSLTFRFELIGMLLGNEVSMKLKLRFKISMLVNKLHWFLCIKTDLFCSKGSDHNPF